MCFIVNPWGHAVTLTVAKHFAAQTLCLGIREKPFGGMLSGGLQRRCQGGACSTATGASLHYVYKQVACAGATQIAALKNLKLNIRRAKIPLAGGVNKFYITDALTSEKITKSRRLEEIRLTILNNLIKFHPESGHNLAWGTFARKDSSVDSTNPLGPRNRRGADCAPRRSVQCNHTIPITQLITPSRKALLADSFAV